VTKKHGRASRAAIIQHNEGAKKFIHLNTFFIHLFLSSSMEKFRALTKHIVRILPPSRKGKKCPLFMFYQGLKPERDQAEERQVQEGSH
jgi:hypothetical protein